MSVINPLAREISAKIVFYGPGLSGKTTSLQFIHDNLKTGQKGDLISLATEGDRTLYFDFLPIQLGRIRDLNLRLQLYTVPGQVFYGATRQLVLDGADGVIFVADSQNSAQERNVESFRDLKLNLEKMGTSLALLPFVIQYNKRDLPDCDSIETLRTLLNEHAAPDFATCASTGEGVLEALKTITRLVMVRLSKHRPNDQLVPSLRRPLTPPTSLRPSVAEVKEFQTQVSHALETLEGPSVRQQSLVPPPIDIPPLPHAPSLTDLGKSERPPRGPSLAAAAVRKAVLPASLIARSPELMASSPNLAALAPLHHDRSPLEEVDEDFQIQAQVYAPQALQTDGITEPEERLPKNNALTIQAPATSPLSFAALWDDDVEIKKIEEDISGGYFAEAVYRATGEVSKILDNLLGTHSPETSATRAQLLGLNGHEYLELRRLGSRPASTITQHDALFALYVLITAHIKESRLAR